MRAPIVYMEKVAGSNLSFMAGKKMTRHFDSPKSKDLTYERREYELRPSIGYHYTAQGKYMAPLHNLPRYPKYVKQINDYESYIPPEHMDEFIRDYDADVRLDAMGANKLPQAWETIPIKRNFLQKLMRARKAKYVYHPEKADAFWASDDSIAKEHQDVLKFLREHKKRGVYYTLT